MSYYKLNENYNKKPGVFIDDAFNEPDDILEDVLSDDKENFSSKTIVTSSKPKSLKQSASVSSQIKDFSKLL